MAKFLKVKATLKLQIADGEMKGQKTKVVSHPALGSVEGFTSTWAAEQLLGPHDIKIDLFDGIVEEDAKTLVDVVLRDERGGFWLVKFASNEATARNEIAMARVTGSVGGSSTVNGELRADVVRLTEAKPS